MKTIALKSALSRDILALIILVNHAIVLYCACAEALMRSQNFFLDTQINRPKYNVVKACK